jgi:ribosomal protein L31
MLLIPTISTIAIRCSACGQLEFHTLSMFDFASSNSRRFKCSCDKSLLYISTKDRKKFSLQVECVMCEAKHMFYVTRQQLWSDDVLTLYCEENSLEIGYIGPKDSVLTCVENENHSIADMAEELGYSDYFDNPDIMYDVLDRLYEIAENGNLKCNCGNHDIAIEIFPDYLELRCEYCNSNAIVVASTEEDLELINKLDEIQLTRFPSNDLQKRRAKSHNKSKKGY